MNDGGPAFPLSHPEAGKEDGMSLRDWFAGNAPPCPDWFVAEGDKPIQQRSMACWNYSYADAMLKERGE